MSKLTTQYNLGYDAGYQAGKRELLAKLNIGRAEQLDLDYLELEHLMCRCKGYIRIGQSLNRQYYVRWKWLEGELADHYTFYSSSDLAEALAGILRCVDAVESGKAKATLDKPARNRR